MNQAHRRGVGTGGSVIMHHYNTLLIEVEWSVRTPDPNPPTLLRQLVGSISIAVGGHTEHTI